MANLGILEHTDAPAVTVADFQGGLAEKAQELLGYGGLLGIRNSRRFQRALADMGIRPFTKESVERYKAETAREANNSRPRFPRVAATVSWIGLGISLVGFILSLVGVLLVNTPIAFFVGGIFSFIVMGVGYSSSITKWEWGVVSLRDYLPPVPEFALQRATEIKQQFPGTEFFIHQLGARRDPFLVVLNGSEEYFIAVWDEPRFDAREEV